MEMNIRGKNVKLTERFEEYISEKAVKIGKLLPKAQRFELFVSKTGEHGSFGEYRAEITVFGPGPVIRAESTAGDQYSAFDLAFGRLLERVRRMKDKQKIHQGRKLTSLHDAAAQDFSLIDINPASGAAFGIGAESEEQGEAPEESTPIVIREKEFAGERMTVEQAVDQMELVGHDFFLFVNAKNDRPSVVYRRKGWNYGVISLTDV